ncbi:MAG TPA: histidine--tRNA ligase [Chloroflexota bacterium]|nr:histidine--tRNA ligase [Chloroflexota bacterium]
MATRVAPRTLQGMRDFLPERMILRQFVVTTLRDVFERFGFEPLETPAIEYADTLEGKYGEEADKLIYKFEDRGGRQVGLRYDLTVPLARVVAQYSDLPKPFKRYQIAPVWRAERPQKGRYREFWQCDVDTVGATSMLADAEVVSVLYEALRRLSFTRFTIRINSRKILTAVAESVGVLAGESLGLYRAIDKLDKIGEDGVRAELAERGYQGEVIDRVFEVIAGHGDSRVILENLRRRFADQPLGLEGIDELEQLISHIESVGVPTSCFRVDLTMVRGLDYYTGPIFETIVEEPRIGSISGGGRYDHLIGMFSGQDVPATGLTLGLERIFDVIEELNLRPSGLGKTVSQALVAVFPDTIASALGLAKDLRGGGIRTEVSLSVDRLSNQLRYASRRLIPCVLIAGATEVAAGQVIIKEMESGEQVTVARAEVVDALRARFKNVSLTGS